MLRFKPISWDKVNDTVLTAVDFYRLGPALRSEESRVIDDYYAACSNANVLTYGMVRGIQCAFTHQLRYFSWNYACNMLSAFYELYRVRESRGQFGEFPLTALFVAAAPLLIIIITLSILNFIIMGKIMKEVEEGPLIYHHVEIACDIGVAVLNIAKDLHFGVIADWLHFLLFGNANLA